ncbi:MAG TPA: allantoinase AllB [Gemmatimonadaceae bacterium]
MSNFALRSQRVITGGECVPATVRVSDGRIADVTSFGDRTAGRAIDVGDSVVMAGVVDTHVHVNEPGRTEWEGFATATRAAAAGGVTTILDMPLNSIPATTSVDALRAKRGIAQALATVNVEFIGGVVPGNASEIDALCDAGVRAFKCFLSPSGVDEFPNVGEDDLRRALPILARRGVPLMVHAELPSWLHDAPAGGSRSYTAYLASRPPEAEVEAIRLLIQLNATCQARLHIVHVSSAQSVRVIREARAAGMPISCETCPHYLTFAAEEIPDGATEYKCAPPIRGRGERDALWRALIAGDIQLVASDHSPCPPEMKRSDGDFFAAWGGIASLQLSLPAVWTGARERGVPLTKVAVWMCDETSALAGLSGQKGKIAPGFDADLVVWNPDACFHVEPATLRHRHPMTPYAGRDLYGVVQETYVRGRCTFTRV